MRPWLLEVNHSPSFTCDTPLDWQIKRAVIDESIQLLALTPAKRAAWQRKLMAAARSRLYGTASAGASVTPPRSPPRRGRGGFPTAAGGASSVGAAAAGSAAPHAHPTTAAGAAAGAPTQTYAVPVQAPITASLLRHEVATVKGFRLIYPPPPLEAIPAGLWARNAAAIATMSATLGKPWNRVASSPAGVSQLPERGDKAASSASGDGVMDADDVFAADDDTDDHDRDRGRDGDGKEGAEDGERDHGATAVRPTGSMPPLRRERSDDDGVDGKSDGSAGSVVGDDGKHDDDATGAVADAAACDEDDVVEVDADDGSSHDGEVDGDTGSPRRAVAVGGGMAVPSPGGKSADSPLPSPTTVPPGRRAADIASPVTSPAMGAPAGATAKTARIVAPVDGATGMPLPFHLPWDASEEAFAQRVRLYNYFAVAAEELYAAEETTRIAGSFRRTGGTGSRSTPSRASVLTEAMLSVVSQAGATASRAAPLTSRTAGGVATATSPAPSTSHLPPPLVPAPAMPVRVRPGSARRPASASARRPSRSLNTDVTPSGGSSSGPSPLAASDMELLSLAHMLRVMVDAQVVNSTAPGQRGADRHASAVVAGGRDTGSGSGSEVLVISRERVQSLLHADPAVALPSTTPAPTPAPHATAYTGTVDRDAAGVARPNVGTVHTPGPMAVRGPPMSPMRASQSGTARPWSARSGTRAVSAAPAHLRPAASAPDTVGHGEEWRRLIGRATGAPLLDLTSTATAATTTAHVSVPWSSTPGAWSHTSGADAAAPLLGRRSGGGPVAPVAGVQGRGIPLSPWASSSGSALRPPSPLTSTRTSSGSGSGSGLGEWDLGKTSDSSDSTAWVSSRSRKPVTVGDGIAMLAASARASGGVGSSSAVPRSRPASAASSLTDTAAASHRAFVAAASAYGGWKPAILSSGGAAVAGRAEAGGSGGVIARR